MARNIPVHSPAASHTVKARWSVTDARSRGYGKKESSFRSGITAVRKDGVVEWTVLALRNPAHQAVHIPAVVEDSWTTSSGAPWMRWFGAAHKARRRLLRACLPAESGPRKTKSATGASSSARTRRRPAMPGAKASLSDGLPATSAARTNVAGASASASLATSCALAPGGIRACKQAHTLRRSRLQDESEAAGHPLWCIDSCIFML